MLKNKIEQSAAQSCLDTFELRVLPFGKISGIKVLNLLNSPTGKTFENRWSRYKESSKNKAEEYRVYYKMALNFSANLKGAKSESVEGYTEHVTRYKKNGKHIDIDIDGNIISFGLLE